MVDLGTLGGSSSVAQAVNDSGQIFGYITTTRGATDVFSWTATGGMVDLGTLGAGTQAVAMNDNGMVVGDSTTEGEGCTNAFAWTAAYGMVDLGNLGTFGLGVVVQQCTAAVAVNDDGVIVGSDQYLLYGGLAFRDRVEWYLSAAPGAPTVQMISPASGGTYGVGEVVPTSFSCGEGSGGPGISTCLDSNGSTSPAGSLNTASLGNHTYTVTATSKDGLSGTASTTYSVVNCTSSGTTTVTVTCPLGTGDTWTVPPGVTQATFTVAGGSGGAPGGAASSGGPGGELQATLLVNAGDTYDIEVGSAGGNPPEPGRPRIGPGGAGHWGGASGVPGGGFGGAPSEFECDPDLFCSTYGGGGGGGASLVALGGTGPANWLLVAGGGGGSGPGDIGAVGGGLSGGSTGEFRDGQGGNQTGTTGSGQQLGGSAGAIAAGGGGGGYWGGAGGSAVGGSGGGGSGFITTNALSGSAFLTTTNVGDGSVTITYVLPQTTATTLTSSAKPTSVGKSVTYTAMVTPTPTGGTVSFTTEPRSPPAKWWRSLGPVPPAR